MGIPALTLAHAMSVCCGTCLQLSPRSFLLFVHVSTCPHSSALVCAHLHFFSLVSTTVLICLCLSVLVATSSWQYWSYLWWVHVSTLLTGIFMCFLMLMFTLFHISSRPFVFLLLFLVLANKTLPCTMGMCL